MSAPTSDEPPSPSPAWPTRKPTAMRKPFSSVTVGRTSKAPMACDRRRRATARDSRRRRGALPPVPPTVDRVTRRPSASEPTPGVVRRTRDDAADLDGDAALRVRARRPTRLREQVPWRRRRFSWGPPWTDGATIICWRAMLSSPFEPQTATFRKFRTDKATRTVEISASASTCGMSSQRSRVAQDDAAHDRDHVRRRQHAADRAAATSGRPSNGKM